MTAVVMLNPNNDRDDRAVFRGSMFILTSVCSFFPVFHLLWGGDPEYVHNLAIQEWILGLVAYLVGVIIFIKKCPERQHPRTFDICGSSHQIFHVFVIIGALLHYDAAWKTFYLR